MKILNLLRYYYLKSKGYIKSNESIYNPKDLFSDVNEVPEVFEKIYSKNIWGSKESVSGKGSELKHTRRLLKKLKPLLKEFNIKSILDAPCGDFNWMKFLYKKGIFYTGMDIVPDLIEKLNIENKDDLNVCFQLGNIIESDLPQSDLIFCRDCLVHLTFDDIQKSLKNFQRSGSKYLLTTTYPDRGLNRDIRTGDWRPINLEKPPFNLPTPLKIIHERNLADHGIYFDKSMGLWKLSDLNI